MRITPYFAAFLAGVLTALSCVAVGYGMGRATRLGPVVVRCAP